MLSQKGSHGSGVEQTILSSGPVLEVRIFRDGLLAYLDDLVLLCLVSGLDEFCVF